MSKLNRFIKTSIIYMLGSISSKLISILMLPLYTNKILPDKFGSYDLAITLMSFIAPIAFFQIWDGMLRYTFDYKDTKEKYTIISNAFAVLIAGFLLYSLLFAILRNYFIFEFEIVIYLYGVLIAINYFYTFISRVFLDNKLYIISGLMNTLATASLNIIFILAFNWDIFSLYLSTMVGLLLQIIIIEKKLKVMRNIRLTKVNAHLIIMMLKFSIPLCIASVSYWLLSGYTKVVISNQLGNYENGMYSVANKFSSLIVLGVSIFQYSWNETAYIISGDDDRFKSYDYAAKMVFRIVILLSGLFILLIKLIFPFYIGSAYHDALNLVPLSIIGVSMNSLAGFLGSVFSSEKNTKWIFWSTLIPAIMNILLAPTMTSLWGIQGSLGALAISFSTIAIMRLIILNKQYNIGLPKNIVFYIGYLLLACYLFFSLANLPLIAMCVFFFAIFIVYEFKELIYKLFMIYKSRVNV